jgi:hypothetical protein
MLEEFCTYEQALALKQLGFDEPCFGFYKLKHSNIYYNTIVQTQIHKFRNNTQLNFYSDLKEKIAAPLKQQVFRWFREKYELFPNFHKNELTDKYRYDEIKNTETYEVLYDSMDYYFNVEFETYEEAESGCIDKLIEIVKNK